MRLRALRSRYERAREARHDQREPRREVNQRITLGNKLDAQDWNSLRVRRPGVCGGRETDRRRIEVMRARTAYLSRI
jgi:hypothetical protein